MLAGATSRRPKPLAPSLTLAWRQCAVNRLTRMVGAMAVKNLELTYLGKPLHQLAEEDFADLAGLLEQCKEVDSKLAAFQSRRLKALIEDAKTTRAVSLEWFEDVRIEVLQMSGRSDDIRRLHDLMTELNNRQFEMTPADLRKYFLRGWPSGATPFTPRPPNRWRRRAHSIPAPRRQVDRIKV